jgi:hypothetical protein
MSWSKNCHHKTHCGSYRNRCFVAGKQSDKNIACLDTMCCCEMTKVIRGFASRKNLFRGYLPTRRMIKDGSEYFGPIPISKPYHTILD